MQKFIIRTSLVFFLLGASPSNAQTKQGNTPEKNPWYFGETFISGVVITIIASTIGGLGGIAVGATKKVSQADKDKFKGEIVKEIIPIIDQKIADNEKIKGLELKLILQEIKGSIESLTTEIYGMNRNHEGHKESVIRRFDEVNSAIKNQEKNSEKLVDRLNQTLQTAFGEYGASVPTIQVRGRRDSKPYDYNVHTDGGNFEQ